MDSRPSFPRIMMNFAVDLSRRSTCARMKVGAVICDEDYRSVFSMGYNGNVTGGKNDCDRHGEEAVGNCGCLHAEENACINCDVSRHITKIVICTHQPCHMCAKRLINLGGVRTVIYQTPYRLTEGLELLKTHHIDTYLIGARHDS